MAIPATIIVTNFNYGRFIAEAIDSALSQSALGCQVIVVDDGSTDESRQIIESYGTHITAVFQPNGGQSAAVNTGFALAQGDLVFFLDADDVMASHSVATVNKRLADHRYSKAQWQMTVLRDGVPSGELMPGHSVSDGEVLPNVLRSGPSSYGTSPTSGCAFRRSWMKQVMPIEAERLPLGSESVLNDAAPVFGEIAAIDEPLSWYRWHSTNHSSRSSAEAEVDAWNYRAEKLKALIEKHLGITIEVDDWRSRNGSVRRFGVIHLVPSDIDSVVPPGQPIVVIPGRHWRPPMFEYGRPVEELEVGEFGEPLEVDRLLTEVAELACAGNQWLVTSGRSFRWDQSGRDLRNALADRYVRVLDSDRTQIFDLSTPVIRDE